MTPHEQILLRMHHERMAGHHFAMLMLRLGVGMRMETVEPVARRVP